MSKYTKSKHWGVIRSIGVGGEVIAGLRATKYEFMNFDNSERFNFLFGDIGFGISLGISGGHKIVASVRALLKGGKMIFSASSPSSFKHIIANRAFSAVDLDLSSGAEIAGGATAGIGVSWTRISAWPFWNTSALSPGRPINNDWFTAQDVTGIDAGAGASGAIQPVGIWLLLD